MPQHIDYHDAADYARGVLTAERRSALEPHLATCAECTALVRWCGEVAELAGREAEYTPPAAAVRLARALFDIRPAESPLAGLPRLIARLLSDTAAEPVPAGVRGVRNVARHALFEAGGYSVDLRLEEDDVTSRLMLVGQVLDPGGATVRAEDGVAVLVRAGRVVANSVLNEFGEFRLDCVPARGLTLQVPIDGGTRRIDVPVSPLLPARRMEPDDAI